MERELKQAVKTRIKEQAIEGLVKENEIDVPAALIEQEIHVLRQQAAQRFGGNQKQLHSFHVNCSKNKLSVA